MLNFRDGRCEDEIATVFKDLLTGIHFDCNPARADLHFHPASIDLTHRAVALLIPEMSRSYSGMVAVAEVAKRLQVHINWICSSAGQRTCTVREAHG